MASSIQTRIDVQAETQTAHGWSYAVVIEHDGKSTEHTVSLAFVDHDYWSGGRVPPSKMVESLLRYALERVQPDSLPMKFDAARLRRVLPRLDEEVRVAG